MFLWKDSCKFVGGYIAPKFDQCTPVAEEGCDGFRRSDCISNEEPFFENMADDPLLCQVRILLKLRQILIKLSLFLAFMRNIFILGFGRLRLLDIQSRCWPDLQSVQIWRTRRMQRSGRTKISRLWGLLWSALGICFGRTEIWPLMKLVYQWMFLILGHSQDCQCNN